MPDPSRLAALLIAHLPHNLLSSIDLPMLMLGEDLRIRHFTPQAKQRLNLVATDIGRPISDIKPRFDLPDLGGLTRLVGAAGVA